MQKMDSYAANVFCNDEPDTYFTEMVPMVFCCFVVAGYAAIAPGENAYLPPNEGYNYPRPKASFPSPPRPSPPMPIYGPATPVPTRPPQATVPPPYSPSPSPYRPPSGPSATPFKPMGPPARPPTPSVRPTGPKPETTAPGYLPPPIRPPSYVPPRPQTPQKPSAPYVPPLPNRPSPGVPGVPSTFIRPQQPAPSPGQSLPTFGENDHLLVPHKPGSPFDFNYAVKDEFGNDYSHNAVNDGDTTNGEYRIQLPDGRTQVVKYSANWASGFHAKISYEGQPSLPGGRAPGFPSPGTSSRPSTGQQSTSGGGYRY